MNVIGRKWILEILWIVVSVILAVLLILPVLESQMDFPWLSYNLIYLIGAFTLVRYIFLFDKHPLASSKAFKILLIFAVPILFFPILEGLHSFLEFNDREGLPSLLNHLSYEQQSHYSKAHLH